MRRDVAGMKLTVEMNFSACVLYTGAPGSSVFWTVLRAQGWGPCLKNHLKSHLAEQKQVFFYKGVGYDPSSSNLIRNYTERWLSLVSQKG